MPDQRAVLTLAASLAVVVLAAFYLGTAGRTAQESVAPAAGPRRVVPAPPPSDWTPVAVDLAPAERPGLGDPPAASGGVTFSGTCRAPVGAGLASLTFRVGEDLAPIRVVAEDDGRFAAELDVPPGTRVRVSIAARGCASVEALLPRLPGELTAYSLGELTLPPGGALTARLVRGDGEPVAGLPVAFERRTARSSGLSGDLFRSPSRLQLVSDANGAVAATEPVACGLWSVVLPPHVRLVRPDSIEVTPAAGAPHAIVVDVPGPGETIRGRVVDLDGAPVAGATIAAHDGSARTVAATSSDASGAWALVRAEGDLQPVSVGVTEAAGFDPVELPGVTDWGAEGVVLVLAPSMPLQLEVVEAATGAAVRDFEVAWYARREGATTLPGRPRARTRRIEGAHVVEGVPAGPALLVVTPADARLAPNRPLEIDVLGVASQRVRVELPRRATVAVRVEFADGRPAIGSRVELLDATGSSGAPLDAHGMPAAERARVVGAGPYALLCDEGATDDEGAIELGWRADGASLDVRVTSPDHLPALVRGVSVDPNGGARTVRVEVDAGAALAGRLGPLAVLDALRTGIGSSAEAFRHTLVLTYVGDEGWNGRWARRTAAVGSDGTFEVDGLAPGPWTLQFRSEPGGADATKSFGPFDVPVAAALELDVSDLAPARLQGQVLLDGAPLADAAVQLVRIARPEGADADARTGEAAVRTDRTGAFVAER
ncbi:MAG: carboxypeptidase-like regulatory domain-containing protein, partial [Planctomycetota bacterium]